MPAPGTVKHHRAQAETSEDPRRHFRLTEAAIDTLAGEYHEWRRGQVGEGCRPDASRKHVLVFLNYLAAGGFFRSVGLTHGMAESTSRESCLSVAEFLLSIANEHIQLPATQQEMADMGVAVNGRTAILFVDGCIIPIQRPDHAGDAFFCGRHGKSRDSINAQLVCDKSGKIRHVVAGVPGAAHDKTAIEFSDEFVDFLATLPPDFVVVGDAAYRGLQRIMVPHIGHNLTPEQQAYNEDISRARQIVERCIGATQLKWRMQQLKENRFAAKKSAEFASKCVVAAAVLHNRFTNFLA